MKSKTKIDSLFLLVLACAMSFGNPRVRAAEGDQAAIASTAEAFVEAFDKGDAKAVAAFWTPDGDYTDQTGQLYKGREAIEKAYSQFFAENKDLNLALKANRYASRRLKLRSRTASRRCLPPTACRPVAHAIQTCS